MDYIAIMKAILTIITILCCLHVNGQSIQGGYIPDEIEGHFIDPPRLDYPEINQHSANYNEKNTTIIQQQGSIQKELNDFANRPASNNTKTALNINQCATNSIRENKTIAEQQDNMQKELNDFANRPVSNNTEAAPTNFDYNKQNTDRFTNSPCYRTLGFDPNLDLTEQEKRYKSCEDDIRSDKIQHVLLIIVALLISAVYLLFIIQGLFAQILRIRR